MKATEGCFMYKKLVVVLILVVLQNPVLACESAPGFDPGMSQSMFQMGRTNLAEIVPLEKLTPDEESSIKQNICESPNMRVAAWVPKSLYLRSMGDLVLICGYWLPKENRTLWFWYSL